MTRQSLSIRLAERPTGDIIPGKTFTQKTEPAPTAEQLKDGDVLVESLYLSLDPAMRGWLDDRRSYIPPVGLGDVMRGAVIGRVLASKNPDVKEGQFVHGILGWQEVGILPKEQTQVVEIPPNGKITDGLGVLGLTGLTAYFGLLKIGEPKAGETVVVSGAAGATGSVVGQIAKIKGARVVGLAGTDEKCKWLTSELGFDVALNYKSPDFKKKFAEATPNYIDVYFDNVGGEILELALNRAKPFSRFVMCGGISSYNADKTKDLGPGIRNLSQVITMRIKMQGFIVFDFAKEYGTARKEIAGWLNDGKLKRKETIIKGGLKEAEQGLANLYKGVNTGKLLVEIKPLEDSKL